MSEVEWTTTVGVPVAIAKWATPVSLATTQAARRRTAPSVPRPVSPAEISIGTPAKSCTRRARSCSIAEPLTTIWKPAPYRRPATWAKPWADHCLVGIEAPG
jgi:hypothetical protein